MVSAFMKRAILFDLDGTLWDALTQIKDSWNLAMELEDKSYRFSLQDIRSYMGLTPEETAPLAFPNDNKEDALSLFYKCVAQEIKDLRINPGKLYKDEEDVLKELSTTYLLYIVSNAACGYIDNYIYGYHFEKYFHSFLCSGDTHLDKHDNIKYLIKRDSLDDVIYVGDTYKDMMECQSAGVKFIHASYGFGKIKEKVHKINGLIELPPLIDQLFDKK